MAVCPFLHLEAVFLHASLNGCCCALLKVERADKRLVVARTWHNRGIIGPVLPMGRKHLDLAPGLCVDPTGALSSAWKNQRMNAVGIDHGQSEVAINRDFRCVFDRLPHDPNSGKLSYLVLRYSNKIADLTSGSIRSAG